MRKVTGVVTKLRVLVMEADMGWIPRVELPPTSICGATFRTICVVSANVCTV